MSDEADNPGGRRAGSCLLRMLLVAGGGLLGLAIGYLGGVFLGCYVLMPESNLCGFVAVFITAPFGLLVGVACGAWIAIGASDD